MNKIIIAIDGYSSTGKSTIAKAIARKLGYIYVDTGAMYRAVTFYCMTTGIIDKAGAIDTQGVIAALPNICIELKATDSGTETCLNGECVEREIRTIEVASNVSKISAIPEVRDAMVAQQQAMGRNKGVVMDGRDIGTVVFPDAELKVFMTAAPEVRAMRRYVELEAKGEKVNLADVRRNIEERDYADTHRAVAPLKQAADAVVLDNSNMTPDEQLDWIEQKVQERLINSCADF
jgi:cytidylate kinase